MDINKAVTGQLFFREAGESAPDGSGRKMMMVVGIIAVPADFDIKSEHKYTVVGDKISTHDVVTLAVHKAGEDLTEEAHGMAAGSMLKQPIWRI